MVERGMRADCRSRRTRPNSRPGRCRVAISRRSCWPSCWRPSRRILLFYDPTRGVDVGTKAEMFTMMRDLAANGYAILFYSTDLAELANVADRTLVLSLRVGRRRSWPVPMSPRTASSRPRWPAGRSRCGRDRAGSIA